MDESVCLLLLLTGFCVSSASTSSRLYFVNEAMTWDKAHEYCISEFTEMAKINDMQNMKTMLNASTGGHTYKVWIGKHKNLTWIWVDGQPATFSNWRFGQLDTATATELCATLADDGLWMDYSCSEKKSSVCLNVKNKAYSIVGTPKTWTDAKTSCEESGLILATIPNEDANSDIQQKLVQMVQAAKEENSVNKSLEAWIGFSRQNICTAAELKDRVWSDEDCNTTLPFFCYKTVPSVLKAVVRMTFKTSANMEDAACSAGLQRQLRAALVNQGVTNFKLTLKKAAVTQVIQTERESSDSESSVVSSSSGSDSDED